jgi:hypothetical protein
VRSTVRYMILLLCLVLVGCQPYPDHGDPIPDFRADSVDFGTRRELKLVNFQGDQQGLLLQFNQPLQKLSELDDPVPFELSIRPPIPVKSMRREGVASVRVTFAEPLPPAHAFKATIPPGWRALTGASFLHPHTEDWTTTPPALSQVEPVPGEAAWEMTFNQPIDKESLLRCLEVPGLSASDFDIVPLDPTHYELRILTPVAVASVHLSPGLKSAVGRVEGLEQDFSLTGFSAGIFFCEKSEWLPQVGAVHFVFSEEVGRTELLENLEGLDQLAAQLYSDDGKDYLLFLGDVSRAREISVSDSLTARSGSRLLHEVNVTAAPLRRPVQQELYRSFQSVAPSATVVRFPTAEKASVATWRLDRKSAVSLVRLSDKEWAAREKLPIEYTPPEYAHKTNKARKVTRFLKKDARPGGLFLVRVATDGKVKRRLLTRSDLIVEGWSLNGVLTGFVARANGIPLSDVALQQCDSSGALLDTAYTAPDGTAAFRTDEHRGLYLWADESLGTALAPIVHRQVTPPIASPGLLWTQGKFFEPGQDSAYLGLWWSEGELPLLEVVDAGGELVSVRIEPPERVGPFYHGSFSAPDRSGEYRIRFRQGTGSHESALVGASTFHVSRLAGQSGAPKVALELRKLESGGYGGSYEWDGRGASLLGAAARLEAQRTNKDGWERVRPGTPDFIPLEIDRKVSMLGGQYELTSLPLVQGRWNLVVEMFDRESPGAVIEKAVLALGDEEVELLGCELKTLSTSTSLARFSFEFTQSESNGRRPLFCRLDAKEKGLWTTRESGEASWLEGEYKWDATLPSVGSYRVYLSNELNGEPLAVWQNTLRGKAADSSLNLTPRPIAPTQRLSIVWPKLAEGTPVWLSILTGKEQVTQRRSADQESGLGEIGVPKTRLGDRELEVVLASLSPKFQMQVDSVEIDTDTLYNSFDAELLSLQGARLVVTGEALQVQVPKQLHYGVVWWSHAHPESNANPGGLSKAAAFVHTGQELADLPLAGPADFTEIDEISILAPPQPGAYHLRMLGLSVEGEVRFCHQPVEVEAESRWGPVTPDWLRPGDAFAAGVRFWSDPKDLGKTGATTSVEVDSSLLPLSYQITSALVEPGSVADMLFSYQAPDFAAASKASLIKLIWNLGVEGQAHIVETELSPLPTAVKTETFRKVTLEPGRRRRLTLPFESHWLARLSVEEEGGALVYLASGQHEAEHVNLSKASAREFAGSGRDTLEVELLSGHPVELEILELRSEPVEDSYSALGLYLLRQLETVDGDPVDSDDAEISQSYLLAHYLVVPDTREFGYLMVPLPGGMRTKGVWLRAGDQLTPLHWSVGEGTVQAVLPDLSKGEHEVVVLVEAHVGGDYFWPGSKVVGIDDEVLSSTVSERVKIDWE